MKTCSGKDEAATSTQPQRSSKNMSHMPVHRVGHQSDTVESNTAQLCTVAHAKGLPIASVVANNSSIEPNSTKHSPKEAARTCLT